MTRNAVPPWSVPVAIHDVPESGRRFDLVAGESARAAVAKSIGLRALPRLEAGFDVTRHGQDGLRIAGHVSATVGQTCVVTLEPVDNGVEEFIDLVFAPQSGPEPGRIAADDAPEPLIGGTVDLGAIATEFLILGIDPYPRKPDVEFTAPTTGEDSGHPFAALAALKTKSNER